MTRNNNFGRSSRFYITMLSFSIVFMLSMTGLFAAAQQEVSVPQEALRVTDMRGRSVTIPERVESVIALGAGSLRLVSYLDAADMVIAVENAGHGREKTPNDFFSLATYRLAFPGFRDLPDIGSAENHEAIIAADPDLIISSTVDVNELDQLEKILGIPVVAVNVDVELYDTDLFYEQVNMLGRVLGKEERAEELVGGIQAAMADFEQRASEVKNSERAYAGGMMFYGPADLLRTTGDYLPFDLTGAENVMPTNPTGNMQPYMTSIEDLIAAAPDYIFIDAANVRLSESGFRENRKVLEQQVPAFENREVYTTFVYKYYGTNWENQLINVYYAGKIMYPELYDDIRIQQKAEEIWDLFFSVPLNYDDVITQQKTGPDRVDWFS